MPAAVGWCFSRLQTETGERQRYRRRVVPEPLPLLYFFGGTGFAKHGTADDFLGVCFKVLLRTDGVFTLAGYDVRNQEAIRWQY
jgi:hypothetical protein